MKLILIFFHLYKDMSAVSNNISGSIETRDDVKQTM